MVQKELLLTQLKCISKWSRSLQKSLESVSEDIQEEEKEGLLSISKLILKKVRQYTTP